MPSITVTPRGGFTVTGTVHPGSPEDMSVDVSAVTPRQFTRSQYEKLLAAAVAELEGRFDELLGVPAAVSEPLPGVTVAVSSSEVAVTNRSAGSWTLLGSAQLAGQVIAAGVRDAEGRRGRAGGEDA